MTANNFRHKLDEATQRNQNALAELMQRKQEHDQAMQEISSELTKLIKCLEPGQKVTVGNDTYEIIENVRAGGSYGASRQNALVANSTLYTTPILLREDQRLMVQQTNDICKIKGYTVAEPADYLRLMLQLDKVVIAFRKTYYDWPVDLSMPTPIKSRVAPHPNPLVQR